MPALSRDETVSCLNPKLDLFTKLSGGIPVDVALLEFQIFEKVSTPGIPVQTYPATVGDRASVDVSNLCPVGNKITTGHYVAPYTVPTAELVGTHEIRWYFKLGLASPEQSFFEEFEVLSAPQATASDQYVSVADVRAAGVNMDPPSDSEIQMAIMLWQSFIDRATRQWFRPIALELNVDGTDSDALHFGVPIISITEIRINNETTALPVDRYRVYNAIQYPIDRSNPRIKLVDTLDQHRDIYSAPMTANGRAIFRKGRQNQYINGVFGYVEADGSPPPLIQRALIKLVIEKLATPLVTPPGGPPLPPPILSGVITEEWTDGHKITYAESGGALRPRAPGLAGITNDQEILNIIRLYRAPIGLATPANPSYR